MTRDKSAGGDLFAEFADAIGTELAEVDPLDLLAEQCRALLDVAATGVVLVTPGGALRIAAMSGEPSLLAALFDRQIDEGPCYDSYTSNSPVIETDLGAHAQRWPAFGPRAQRAGVMAAYALPLQVRERTIGALGLFTTQSAALTESEARLGKSLADHAALSLVSYLSARKAWVLAGQLQTALSSRVVIEQAKGMLAERGGTNVDKAFEALRHFSRTNRRKLTDIAHDIVEGRLDLGQVLDNASGVPAAHKAAHQWHASRRRRSRPPRQRPASPPVA
jgi:ANTAR domain-containing protein/GAF domain-containing protein